MTDADPYRGASPCGRIIAVEHLRAECGRPIPHGERRPRIGLWDRCSACDRRVLVLNWDPRHTITNPGGSDAA